VSTEAGSEGVNLQAANVLVNFDLPWNPMIVEQRIGRIQRLASEHASVCICNMILRGTFEEYIVGRLMEKLQLASHARLAGRGSICQPRALRFQNSIKSQDDVSSM
jgi:SNF2 family DNA or RNA helicase